MGTIRVGKNADKVFNSGGGMPVDEKSVSTEFSEEEKARLLTSIKQMPKDKWVSALRSVGLDDEANECERILAEEHLRELNEKERSNRLREIMSMPEDDQLALLLAEGFDDAARELSEKLAIDNAEKVVEGNGVENEPQEEVVVAAPAELSDVVEKKDEEVAKVSQKKRGRKPRSSKK